MKENLSEQERGRAAGQRTPAPDSGGHSARIAVYSNLVCWRKLQGISDFQRLCERAALGGPGSPPTSSLPLSLPSLQSSVVNGQFVVEFE